MCDMHDSGKREKFETGAVRDAGEGKPRLDLISPFFEERFGAWLGKGAEKYKERNWEKGIPFSRCLAGIKRHRMRYMQGERTEDNLAAIAFGAMALMHYEEMIERGVLPASLNDMPDYRPPSPMAEETGKERREREALNVYNAKMAIETLQSFGPCARLAQVDDDDLCGRSSGPISGRPALREKRKC